ncbi:MAG: protein phosphatase 2C domain-containing protein [Eubacteriales bacterium]|nr:protein phosphatase 2C domain-containing protein [Eubacteriales bacterium]
MNEDSFQLQGRIYPDTLNSREQKIDECDDYWQIFAVTDGMGGAGVGDIASRVVQSYLLELRADFSLLNPYNFSFSNYIQDFLTKVDLALRERLRKQADQAVGCSLALLMLAGESCYTMAIGNCRIYLYRQGQLYRMSQDHVLGDDGSGRPLLFLGNHPGIKHLRAQNLKHMQVQPDDHFFLCTDGITAALQDEDIKWVLDKNSPLETYVESLFQNARRYDARDNQTILGLKIKGRRIFTGVEAKDSLYPDRRPLEPRRFNTYPGSSMTSSIPSSAPKGGLASTSPFSQATGIYQASTFDLARQNTTGAYIPLNTLTGTNRQTTGIYDLPSNVLGAWTEGNWQPDQVGEEATNRKQAGHSLQDLIRQNLGLTILAFILVLLLLILFLVL